MNVSDFGENWTVEPGVHVTKCVYYILCTRTGPDPAIAEQALHHKHLGLNLS